MSSKGQGHNCVDLVVKILNCAFVFYAKVCHRNATNDTLSIRIRRIQLLVFLVDKLIECYIVKLSTTCFQSPEANLATCQYGDYLASGSPYSLDLSCSANGLKYAVRLFLFRFSQELLNQKVRSKLYCQHICTFA